MSILGPTRKATQVEVSLTDARKLGIAAPVRESGCIEGTPGCKLVGPAGEYEISEGLSCLLMLHPYQIKLLKLHQKHEHGVQMFLLIPS